MIVSELVGQYFGTKFHGLRPRHCGVREGFGQISRNAGVVLALLRNTWGLKDQVKLCQGKTHPLCSVLTLSAVRGSVSRRGFVPPLICHQSLSCLLISVLRPFTQPICRGGTSPQPKNSSDSLMTP